MRRTANVLWNQNEEEFEFRVVDSVKELERLIRKRDVQGSSARLAAGYCWPWSTEKAPDGHLVEDVVIGNWRRPWNARPELTRLPAGVPKSMYWATDPGGINQVGCIYTAQGFEFDYVGVIWGPDLRYDPDSQEWIGDPTRSHDGLVKRAKRSFLENVQHVYRVLLTRGLKGCYVYFLDADTRRFVESRMELIRQTGRERADTSTAPMLAADVPEDPYGDLNKRAATVRAAIKRLPALAGLAERSELVADIGSQLERDDYNGWESEPELKLRLQRSVARLLRASGQEDSAAERLADALLDAL